MIRAFPAYFNGIIARGYEARSAGFSQFASLIPRRAQFVGNSLGLHLFYKRLRWTEPLAASIVYRYPALLTIFGGMPVAR
jgi:hypothetical protein